MVNNENIVRYKINMRIVKGKNHVSGIVDKPLDRTVFAVACRVNKLLFEAGEILLKIVIFERNENVCGQVDKAVFFPFFRKQR